MNPDRTLAEDGRFITDMREPNKGCLKEDHPPAAQPRHREVAREILWWQARCPKVRVLLAKRDVKSAFKLLWIRLADVGLMSREAKRGRAARGHKTPVHVFIFAVASKIATISGCELQFGYDAPDNIALQRLLSNQFKDTS